MCGRSRCQMSNEYLKSLYQVRWHEANLYEPKQNLSPGQYVPVLMNDNNCKVLRSMIWGLIPSFTPSCENPDYFRMYNARSESLKEKPSFKNLLSRRRCVVIIDGYYEWRVEAGVKQPYYLYFADKRPMEITGLFDVWKSEKLANDSSTGLFYSVTMLTGPSSPTIQYIHSRQPVILSKDKSDMWLNLQLSYSELDEIIKVPYSGTDFVYHPVHMRMNQGTYQGKDCAAPVQLFPSIASFFQKISSPSKPDITMDSSQLQARDTLRRQDSSSFGVHDSSSAIDVTDSDVSQSSYDDVSETHKITVLPERSPKLESSNDICSAGGESFLGSCLCPMCATDMSLLDEKHRNEHAYSCNGLTVVVSSNKRNSIDNVKKETTPLKRKLVSESTVAAGTRGAKKRKFLPQSHTKSISAFFNNDGPAENGAHAASTNV